MLGGAIISVLRWRWVFFVNLPLCVLTLWALRYIPLDEVLQSGKISWLILIGAGSAILCVMLMINGTQVGLFALVFVVAMAAIWIGEPQTDAPLLPRLCYRNPHFVVPSIFFIGFSSLTGKKL